MVPIILMRAVMGVASVIILTGCTTPTFGLKTEFPPSATGPIFYPKYPEIDTLQPTLRWSEFPRPQEYRIHGEEFTTRVSNVSYDLRVWKDGINPYDCQVWFDNPFYELTRDYLYSRNGLPSAVHRIETPLKPWVLYCWTVRARFMVDGHPRVTDWSRQGYPTFNDVHGYGFSVPGN